jgi:hypothetical protein
VARSGTAAHRKVEAPVAALDGLLAVLRPAQVQVDELVAEGLGRHVLILLPVDSANEVALLLEALRQVGGDEAAGAGDADLHLLVSLGEFLLGDGGQNLAARRGGGMACAGWAPCACACVSRASVRVRTARRSTRVVLCGSHRRMQSAWQAFWRQRTMATWCFPKSHKTRDRAVREKMPDRSTPGKRDKQRAPQIFATWESYGDTHQRKSHTTIFTSKHVIKMGLTGGSTKPVVRQTKAQER